MPNRYRATYESPPKGGGDGWLVNGDQGLLVRITNDTPTTHGQWVVLNTSRWERAAQSTGHSVPQAHASAQRH